MHKLIAAALLSTSAAIANAAALNEPINLVFVVEPQIIEQHGSEAVQAFIEKQLSDTNSAFKTLSVTYQVGAVVVDATDHFQNGRDQGFTGVELLHYSYQSLGVDLAEFTASIHPDDRPQADTLYNEAIDGFFNLYSADNLVFIVKDIATSGGFGESVVGAATSNAMVAVTMTAGVNTLTHELGHLWHLNHPSNEQCNTFRSIMCYGDRANSFSQGELESMTKIVNGAYPDVGNLLEKFYMGQYSAPVPKIASAKVVVKDNPIAHDLPSTDVMVSLVDDNGAPVVFEKETSLELYTKSGSAIYGNHYDKAVYQRVTFAAGETQKNITLAVQSDTAERQFTLGARYGVGIKDSQPVNVTIKAKPTSAGGNTGGNTGNTDTGSSGGGAFGFGWIILLGLGLKLRQVSNKKPSSN